MKKEQLEQVEITMEEHYQALQSVLDAIKNLAIAVPRLTPEDKIILNKVKAQQPLEEVVAEFEEINKWKKQMKGLTCIYINVEKELLVNNEFIDFIRTYRNKIDEETLQQITENKDTTENMNIYTKYNYIIREILKHNTCASQFKNDVFLNMDKKSISYIKEKYEDITNKIKFIKELSNIYTYRNNSEDPYIKVKDEYLKILNEAVTEMNELEKELNKDS